MGDSKGFLRLCFQNKTPLSGVNIQVFSISVTLSHRDEIRSPIFPYDPVNNGNRGSLSAFVKWIWM